MATRARGHIQQRDNGTYRVFVYGGCDPLTGKQYQLTGTAKTAKEAEKLRTSLLSQVDQGRKRATNRTVAEVIDAWLEVSELELSTRDGYEGYIRRHIAPTLGNLAARKLTVELLERFYARLRTKGGVGGRPLAASSVRQVHFILRAALGQAVKWGWLAENVAALATPPRFVRPEVLPPTIEGVTRLLDAAREADPDFGALLWLAVITGVRRGELCALRWAHVRLAEGDLLVSRNYIQRGSVRVEKDTKTHQARRIALDETTVAILTEHRERCRARAKACRVSLRDDGYVFSQQPDGSEPLLPQSVTQRLRRLARRVGVPADLRRLRHFMGMGFPPETGHGFYAAFR